MSWAQKREETRKEKLRKLAEGFEASLNYDKAISVWEQIEDFEEASYPGRLFIRTYYSLSPPVADNISESDGKRKIVRTALGPIVKVLKDRYSN